MGKHVPRTTPEEGVRNADRSVLSEQLQKVTTLLWGMRRCVMVMGFIKPRITQSKGQDCKFLLCLRMLNRLQACSENVINDLAKTSFVAGSTDQQILPHWRTGEIAIIFSSKTLEGFKKISVSICSFRSLWHLCCSLNAPLPPLLLSYIVKHLALQEQKSIHKCKKTEQIHGKSIVDKSGNAEDVREQGWSERQSGLETMNRLY